MANRINWSEEAAANQSGVAGTGRGGIPAMEFPRRATVNRLEQQFQYAGVIKPNNSTAWPTMPWTVLLQQHANQQ